MSVRAHCCWSVRQPGNRSRGPVLQAQEQTKCNDQAEVPVAHGQFFAL
jgi:hypothetical protein